MGREDIDVRCLGRGRPFVIELKEPRLREVDYQSLQDEINRLADGSIEVSDLRASSRSEVVRIKDTPAEKSYTIRFSLEAMNEKEYATLTAPLDLTRQDDKRGKKRHRRGDKKRDNTKPLPVEITVEEDDTPKEADYQKMKKAELVSLCEEREFE